MIRFVAVVLGTALALMALVALSVRLGWIVAAPSYCLESLLVLTIFTIVIYRYLDRLSDPSMFIQVYLLSMVVKLIAYGVYVAIVILNDKPGANMNVLFFLILYVLFTALEVAFLHQKISGKDPR